MAEPTFFATIEKNRLEDVRVALDEYQGRDLIDIRQWADFRAGPVETRGPTKKGISLSVRKLPELIAALNDALAEAQRRGLVPE